MINVKVLEEKENPVLKRKDLLLMLDHKGEATPKSDDVVKLVIDKFKGDPKKIEIVYMFSKKGAAKTKAKVLIWKDKVIEKPKEKKKSESEQPTEEKPEE